MKVFVHQDGSPILEPLRNLLDNGELGTALEETARIIYSNESITVNAAAAAAAVALGLACKSSVSKV